VSPLWQPVPEVFSIAAGMHRVVWRPIAPSPPATPGQAPKRRGERLTGTFHGAAHRERPRLHSDLDGATGSARRAQEPVASSQ